MQNNLGTLYIVATPIGNMEDITFRAIRILKEVDTILCEDTRTTKNLLDKYDIHTKTISYNAHSSADKHKKIIDSLKEGKDIALVSDAGTPCISDPGVLLVAYIREEFGNDAKVSPIPGASAIISALSASGVSSAEFTFLGFIPHKKGRETIFKNLAETYTTTVFYESTHRIMKTLDSLIQYCPNHKIVLAREITKKFEEFIKGSPKEVFDILQASKEKQKGEFVVIVDPR